MRATLCRIETGVPVPELNHRYPFKRMKVGDSFTCTVNNKSTIYGSATWAGIKVTIRKLKGGAVRVWRVK